MLLSPYETIAALKNVLASNERIQILHRLLICIGYDRTQSRCRASATTLQSLVNAGLLTAIQVQLSFLLKRDFVSDQEVEMLSVILEAIYVCCPAIDTNRAIVELSADMFVLLLESCNQGISTLPALTIFHTFSSESTGASIVADIGGILRTLGKVVHASIDEKCHLEVLGIFKNLTYFCEEYREAISKRTELLQGFCRIHASAKNPKIKERLSAIFRNMAISVSARARLARHGDVTSVLISMLKDRTSKNALRNTINTIVSISVDVDASLLLLFHKDGAILAIIKQLVLNSNDPTVQKRANRALRQMTNDTSAPLLLGDRNLLVWLASQAQYNNSVDVRHESVEAFSRIASFAKSSMPQHQEILDMLTTLANRRSISSDVIARSLKNQTQYPENLLPVGKHRALIEACIMLVVTPEASKSCKQDFCVAITNLIAEPENKMTLANTTVLDALAELLRMQRRDHDDIRRSSFQILEELSAVPVNRKGMSNHSTLLKSLLSLASTNANHGIKNEVKQMIITLAATL